MGTGLIFRALGIKLEQSCALFPNECAWFPRLTNTPPYHPPTLTLNLLLATADWRDRIKQAYLVPLKWGGREQ